MGVSCDGREWQDTADSERIGAMISVDGYYPLSAYLRTAQSIITERLWGYFLTVNEPPEDEDELDEFDWTAPIKVERTEYWRENIEIAARFLVHDIMRRAGEGVDRACILRPDGTRVTVQQSVTEPNASLASRDGDYANHRNWRMQDRVVRREEYLFGTDTFKDDFWLEYFTRDRIFLEFSPSYSDLVRPERRRATVVDWKHGIIDISRLRAVASAREHLIAAKEVLERSGCEAPKPLYVMARDDSDITALTRMFEPYDACPVLLHEECWKGLDEISAGPRLADRDAGSSSLPTEAIIAVLNREGPIGKAAVKSRLIAQFPEMSARQFERYWRVVADERPELRKPGRKGKKSYLKTPGKE